jgi:hypothetical protein
VPRSSLPRLLASCSLALAATAAAAQPPADRLPSLDEQFARVAARAPAFGGLFVDEATGTVRVYSWNPTATGHAQVRDAVRAVLGDALGGARVEILAGQYGFRELAAWHARALGLLALPGMVSTDVDERSNRVRIGVERREVAWQVRDRLGALGVPAEAVEVVVTRPFHYTSLTSKHRPVIGGLQIAFSQYLCTLGFEAVRAGVSGWVINSHCSGKQGGVQGTVEYQPSNTSANRIGVETVDPVYFSKSPCPGGRKCRRSDSAFVRRDAAVTTARGVARPALGAVAWNGTDKFRIVKKSDPLVGQIVTKVGRTTGRTKGAVQFTCVTVNVSGTNITQICQSIAGYGSAGGDSGSPVFRIVNSPAKNDVSLGGIHWGSDGTIAVFSTISQIQRSTAPAELGTLSVCSSGFGC